MATTQRPPVHSPPAGPLPSLPRFPPDFDINDSTFFAVYSFIKNFVGAPSNTSVMIDTKIEQAIDLVKSHLMFAVREEVTVLKEKITELLNRISNLETENAFLKANARPEIIHALKSRALWHIPNNRKGGPPVK